MKRPLFAAWLTALLLSGLSVLGFAFGQETIVRDYYVARSDRGGIQALNNMDRLHYQPALKALQLKRYGNAQGDLEFILKYFPNHPHALAKIGEVSLATKRPDLANKHFEAAISRYPQHDETHVIYGTFLHKLGRLDAAVAEYQRALEINPDSAYGHYNLGLAYVDRKDYSQANAHAQKAYQLGVSFPGLRKKLQAVGAWKPLESSSSGGAAGASTPPQQDERKAD